MNKISAPHPSFVILRNIAIVAGLAVLGLVIVKNACYLKRYLSDAIQARTDWAGDVPVGRKFLLFSSILHKVTAVGYYTDGYGPDFWYTSPALVEYQQAQAALAPILLDAEDPFKYEWVLFVCYRRGCEAGLIQAHNLALRLRVDGRLILGKAKDVHQ
ncbi:MAG: hypothetical protein HGA80_02840 [Candidatus Omnitrophica bacterium]|nr:hypothetical protein [Candidatus Omnitrophota bacterium]